MPAPDFSPGERVFKPAGTLYLAMTGLLALVRMPLVPQELMYGHEKRPWQAVPAPDFSPGERVFKPARRFYLAMIGL